MNKIKDFFKEYKFYIITFMVILIIFNIKLPYYVLAPGGIIKIDDRITTEDKNESEGSINLLYVSQYEGNIVSVLPALLFKKWDIEKIEESKISDENLKEIKKREKIMLDNSISNAIYVAYKKANKDIKITKRHNMVIATTLDNDIMIGDEILKVDGIEVTDINTIKEIISTKNPGEKVNLLIKRDNKELNIDTEVALENNIKIIGVAVITNYEYELDPEINIKFKNSEGGSSGGVMMAVSIYNAITNKDITKGLNIAGTGEIDINGNAGEIGGVKYKIMGAVKNNIDIVFVPKANYDEAINTKNKYKYDIDIISIDTFDDVIEYLNNL